MGCFNMLSYLLFFSVLFSCSGDGVSSSISDDAKAIPLGGNSFITRKIGSERVTNEGFVDWKDKETVFSTFFKVNQEGDLALYLKYSVDDDENEIKVSCNGKSFNLKLPKSESDTTVYVGQINCEVGYVKVDFQGVRKAGVVYAKPSSLLVDGTAAQKLSFVDDFSFYWGRRGPSVHLSYTMPEDKTAEWFYNEVVVPEGEDRLGSYFMANGFGEGYFGIQVNSETERRVLFSVWSPFETDNPKDIPDEHKIILVKKGNDVQTGEFGNEGSGGQSFLKYNWRAGIICKFLTHIRPVDKGYSEYTSYFFFAEEGAWRLIARFLRPGTTTYYTRAHSFLENFLTETGYQQRKAYYTNQWIYTTEGQWIELTNARFTADDTARQGARMDYKGGSDGNGFFLQNCGFFDDFTPIGQLLDRKPEGVAPQINFKELE